MKKGNFWDISELRKVIGKRLIIGVGATIPVVNKKRNSFLISL